MSLTNKINIYLRIIATVLVTAYYAIKVVFFISGNKQKYSRNSNCWGANVLRIFGINVDVKGLNHLTPGKTYILASNHSSLLDIPVMFSTFKEHNYIIIYKKELEKIPIFGKSLKVSPFVSIDRSNARDAMASIEKTLEQMKDKDCPIIFPEGTRSEDGELQNFKRGAFLLASRSKKPIVPIAIIGTSEIVRKGTLDVKSRGTVQVIINPPIENSSDMDRIAEKALMEKVHNIIKESIENNS